MVSKREILENVKELSDRLNKFIPTQTIQNEAQMYAQQAAIDSQVANSNIYGKVYYNRWIILNQWANYFTGVFRYEADEIELTLFINRAMRYAFIFGYVHVWVKDGKPELVGIDERDGKIYATIIAESADDTDKGEGYYATFKGPNKGFEVSAEDLILYKFESLGYTAFMTLEPVIKFEQLSQKSLYNETLLLPTRLVNKSISPDPENKAARQIIDFNSPILYQYAGGKDTFEGLDLKYTSDPLLEVIEYTKNYYYDILGRRSNIDFKKSHSLDSEISASQQSFKILERDRYLHFKAFLQRLSKKTGQTIMLETSTGDYKNCMERDIIKEEEQNANEGDKSSGMKGDSRPASTNNGK